MKRRLLLVGVSSFALMFLSACAEEPATTETTDGTTEAAAATDLSADPLSGTWTGTWGPTETHRNDVTLQLTFDGTSLTGTVNPGDNAIQLSKATYAPDTHKVMMEADATGHEGPVHFMIEGMVDGNTMMGSWNHDDKTGDFKITKN